MRRKPKYNDMRLIHEDIYGNQTMFYANEVTKNKQIIALIGAPIKDDNSRYITDSDIDFKTDDLVIVGDETKRITAIPELKKSAEDNNSRRGYYRTDKVIETT